MSNENILTFYEAILDTAKVTHDENGHLYVQGDTADDEGNFPSVPWLIMGKPCVLPTRDNLRKTIVDGTIVFQPLSENVLLGESEVIKAYRTKLMEQVNMSLYMAMFCMSSIVLNPKSYSRVHPEFTTQVAKLKNFDKKTFEAMVSACEALTGGEYGQEAFIVRMGLRRGGEIRVGDGEAKHFTRRAIVDFPLLTVLNEDEEEPGKILGKKFRASKRAGSMNDYALIREIVLSILPKAAVANFYSAGSKDGLAPNLSAVLMAARNIIEPVNTFLEANAGALEGHEEILDGVLPLNWVDIIEDLSIFKAEIAAMPMLEGNGGTSSLVDKLKDSRNIHDNVQRLASESTTERTTTQLSTPSKPQDASLVLPTISAPAPAMSLTAVGQHAQPAPSGGVSAASLLGIGPSQANNTLQQAGMMSAQGIRDAMARRELTPAQAQIAMNQLQQQMANPQQYNVGQYLSMPQFHQYLSQTNPHLFADMQRNTMNLSGFFQSNPMAMQALNMAIAAFNQATGIGQPVVGLAVQPMQTAQQPGSFAFSPTAVETIGGYQPQQPQGQQPFMPRTVSASSLL